MAEITVGSEDEAFSLMQSLLSRTSETTGEAPRIVFSGWPEFVVHLPHTPIDGSISPTMMGAFLEYQDAINRAYSVVINGDSDLRLLKDRDRQNLEFRVKVEKGSSDYTVVIANALEKIGLEAVAKMSPDQVVMVVLGLAAIVGGTFAFRHHVSTKAEVRRAEIDANRDVQMAQIDAEERGRLVDLVGASAAAEAEKLKILAQVMAVSPALQKVEEFADAARTKIIRAIGEEGGGTVQGVSMTANDAHAIASTPRRKSEMETVAGIFRVMKVDAAFEEGFKVTFANPDSGWEITASLRDALLSEAEKAAVQAAEWQRSLVSVEIKGRRIGAKIIDGIIVRATPYGSPKADETS